VTGAGVVLAALGSALAAAGSNVLQHRAARRAPFGGSGRLLTHLLANPVWIAGLLAGGVGLSLHVVALSAGRLVVVQPLLVSGILFALPLSVVLEGRRPPLRDWLVALVLVAGLAVFLLTANPSAGAERAPTWRLVLCAAVTLVLLLGLGAAGLRGPAARRAALLGTASGVGFGLVAALLKQASAVAAPLELARSWSGYAVIGVGALSIAVTQLAYRAGPLAASLPALTIGDPVVAIVLGILAFGERPDARPGPLAATVVAFAVMAVSATVLACWSDAAPDRAPRPAASAAEPAGR
jgi:drug/metabolite transporter (DMT)-like permease